MRWRRDKASSAVRGSDHRPRARRASFYTQSVRTNATARCARRARAAVRGVAMWAVPAASRSSATATRAPERRRSRGGAPQQRSSGAIDSETSPPPRRAAEPAQPSGPSGLHSAARHSASFFFFIFYQNGAANNLSTSSRTKKQKKIADGSSCALIQTTQPTGPGCRFLGCSRQPDRSK